MRQPKIQKTHLPNRFSLFFNSNTDIFDAPAGMVAMCTYPFGNCVFVKTPLTGRQTEPPHLIAPLFINAPVMIPLFRTACEWFRILNGDYFGWISIPYIEQVNLNISHTNALDSTQNSPRNKREWRLCEISPSYLLWIFLFLSFQIMSINCPDLFLFISHLN